MQGIAQPAPSPIGSALTAGLGAFSLRKTIRIRLMNPKIMKRPMFRMGGPARVNYNTGTSLKEIEDLIAKEQNLETNL